MKTKQLFFSMMAGLLCLGVAQSQTTQATNAVSNANSYLGTSNNYDVIFKRMAVEAGKLTTNSVSFGVNSFATPNSVAIGVGAGRDSSGSSNINIGGGAGEGTSDSSSYNINIGGGAGKGTSNSSSYNIYIGGGAGGESTGNNNICIGASAGESSTMNNTIIIGNALDANIVGNPNNKLIIDNSESNNPLIWGDFATDNLKFNVASTPSSGVEINGPAGQSGLQFSNLTATSPAAASNGKVLTLDSTGKVVLAVDGGSGGGASASNVYTIGLSSSSLPLIGTTATVSNTLNNYLDDVINNAISLGYKKIYIQEGVYKVNNTINIISKNGITIEGAGMETIVLPSAAMGVDVPIINVSTYSYNNIIKNLAFQPHDVDAGKVVNTCIKLGAGCDRNLFENLYIGRKSSQGNFTYSTKPIFIDLPTGEADFNTFQNINFYKCIGGIYIKATDGIFNSNTFQNISLHKSKVGIEFEGNGASDNVFTKIKFQTSVINDGLVSNDMTTHTFKNVGGSNNTIRDVFIADWKKTASSAGDTNYNPYLQYVINTVAPATPTTPATGAFRTIIENVETEADGYNGKPFTYADYYQDLGTSTQFLNNAMGNRNTDYLMNNVNNVSYLGQEQNSYLNNFNVEKMDKTYFSGRNSESSFFAIEKFNNLFLGSNNVSSGAATANTYLRGSNVFVNLGTVSPTAGQVLSSADDGGKLQWKTAVNIYENNGWIKSLDQALTGTTPVLVDNKLRTLYTQSGPYLGTDYNSTSVLFTRNGSAAFDIMYLYSGTRNTAGTALNADQSVVIGANAKTIATNTNNAGYKLLVNGKVKVKDEVYILNTAAHWADYVFKSDYKLKPLFEVEHFINENGYLPNMPSAKEIETNGLPLADMTTRQQEKIEELTLYAIAQEKKIEAQQKEIEKLKNLETEVETLKKAINQLITNKE